MVINVALIEDDPEFLRRFIAVVESAPSLALAGAASTLADGLKLIDNRCADVYLVDLGLPDGNGIDLIRHAAQHHPTANTMVVTVFGDDDHVIRSIEAGATGYLLKDTLPEEMVSCIHDLHRGGSPVNPIIARRLLRRFRPATAEPSAPAPTRTDNPLSERETEILGMIAKGLSFTEIGDSLGISPHTVTAHVRKIYGKLAVRSRGEAVFEARQMGLIEG
jgi:DNA-binding NarL/FixJ family response regulator